MSTEKDEANVKICKEAHKALKLYCVNNDLNIKDAANMIIFKFMRESESAVKTAKKEGEIESNADKNYGI